MTATDVALDKDLDEAPPSPPDDLPTPADEPSGRSGGGVLKALLAMVVVAAAMTALILFVANRDQPGVAEPLTITVRPDAGQGIVDGTGDDVIDEPLIRLQPGQVLVLENDDWGPHTLGSLTAERGQTVRVSYPTEGRHVTTTTLRADGRVTILVEDTTR